MSDIPEQDHLKVQTSAQETVNADSETSSLKRTEAAAELSEVPTDKDVEKATYSRGQQSKWLRTRGGDKKPENPRSEAKRQRLQADIQDKWVCFTSDDLKIVTALLTCDDGNPLYNDARRPKKKVAVLMGYCGTGYHGMQLNEGAKTIEGDLFEAMVKAGAISRDNSNDLKKNGFMRAARTDKGVHAAGNVVSLKLIIEDDDIVKKINDNLPEQIRVWGYERTNKSFDCRKMCSSRIYEYLLPTYSLLPPKPTATLAKLIKEAEELFPGKTRDDPEGKAYWAAYEKALRDAGITAEQEEAVAEMVANPETTNMITQQIQKDIKAIAISWFP
ncbi:unnamed protein product [[Candida] boidinii]|nr:unnamed protein product [[Candida] boidinii]